MLCVVVVVFFVVALISASLLPPDNIQKAIQRRRKGVSTSSVNFDKNVPHQERVTKNTFKDFHEDDYDADENYDDLNDDDNDEDTDDADDSDFSDDYDDYDDYDSAEELYDTDSSEDYYDKDDELSPPPITPEHMAVVFSWHRNTKLKDSRWQQQSSVGVGNEFKVAVMSVRAALPPDVPLFVFTNVPKSEIDKDTARLVRIVNVDLFAEAGLDALQQQAAKKYERIGFGTKPMALIYGWSQGLLPEYVLYLDVDVIVSGDSTSSGRALLDVFQPLLHYDVAAVFEGFAIGPRPTPAAGDGWEINTGVLAVRHSALPLVRRWLDIFKREQAVLDQYVSGEQQALMLALEEAPWYRAFPLSSLYNFRRPTVLPQVGFAGAPSLSLASLPLSPLSLNPLPHPHRWVSPAARRWWCRRTCILTHAPTSRRTRTWRSTPRSLPSRTAPTTCPRCLPSPHSLYHITTMRPLTRSLIQSLLNHVSKVGGPVHYLCDILVG